MIADPNTRILLPDDPLVQAIAAAAVR